MKSTQFGCDLPLLHMNSCHMAMMLHMWFTYHSLDVNLNALSFSPFNKQAYQESRKNIDPQLSHNSRELNPDAADLQRKKRKEGFGEGGGKHRHSRTENGRQVLGPQIDKWLHRNENTKLFRFSKEVNASKYIRVSHQLKSRIVLVVIE